MKFTIGRYEGGAYWLACDGRHSDGLAWDEMLGEVAKLIMLGRDQTIHNPLRWAPVRFSSKRPSELLIAEKVSGLYWNLSEGNRFTGALTDNELLGFVAAYTRYGDQLFGGLQTYETHVKRWRWRHQQPIAGLLTYGARRPREYERGASDRRVRDYSEV